MCPLTKSRISFTEMSENVKFPFGPSEIECWTPPAACFWISRSSTKIKARLRSVAMRSARCASTWKTI